MNPLTTEHVVRDPLFDEKHTYTVSQLIRGKGMVYRLEDEPLTGPQREVRMAIKRVYDEAMEKLLLKKNRDSECWAHDYMHDSYTHVNYEYLDALIDHPEVADLQSVIHNLDALLKEFDPEYVEEFDDEEETPRVFCADEKERAEMQALLRRLSLELRRCAERIDVRVD